MAQSGHDRRRLVGCRRSPQRPTPQLECAPEHQRQGDLRASAPHEWGAQGRFEWAETAARTALRQPCRRSATSVMAPNARRKPVRNASVRHSARRGPLSSSFATPATMAARSGPDGRAKTPPPGGRRRAIDVHDQPVERFRACNLRHAHHARRRRSAGRASTGGGSGRGRSPSRSRCRARVRPGRRGSCETSSTTRTGLRNRSEDAGWPVVAVSARGLPTGVCQTGRQRAFSARSSRSETPSTDAH